MPGSARATCWSRVHRPNWWTQVVAMWWPVGDQVVSPPRAVDHPDHPVWVKQRPAQGASLAPCPGEQGHRRQVQCARRSSCSAEGSPVSAPRASSRRQTSTSSSSTRTTTTASSRCCTSWRRVCSTRRRLRIRCVISSSIRRTRGCTRRPSPAIDLEAREVQFADMPPLQYDYLVIGLGAVVQFFGCEGAPEHAFPLYTVEDALRLRIARRRALGGRRPRPVTHRRRSAQHRRRRRRPDRDRERRCPERALRERLREGLRPDLIRARRV